MDTIRSQSVMQVRSSSFQTRAGKFLKKVAIFGKRKHGSPYKNAKPFMSQPALNDFAYEDPHNPAISTALSEDLPLPATTSTNVIFMARQTGLPSGAAPPRRSSQPDRSTSPTPIQMASYTPPPPRITPSATVPASGTTLRRPPLPDSLNRLSMTLTPGGAARLTPSVIPHHPFPVLNLPALSTPSAVPEGTRKLRLRASLRAMPALPLQGSDVKDAVGEEEEEDPGEMVESDDDDDDDTGIPTPTGEESEDDNDDEDMSQHTSTSPSTAASTSPSQTHANPSLLPNVDTSCTCLNLERSLLTFTITSPAHSHSHTPTYPATPLQRVRSGDATPTASRPEPNTHANTSHFAHPPSQGYFGTNPDRNGSTPIRSPVDSLPHIHPHSPPLPPDNNGLRRTMVRPDPATFMPLAREVAPALIAGGGGGARPAMYRHASRSMIDVLAMGRRESFVVEKKEGKSIVSGVGKGNGEEKGKGKESGKSGPSGGSHAIQVNGILGAGAGSGPSSSSQPAAEHKEVAAAVKIPENQNTNNSLSAAPAYDSPTYTLRRRRSMPTFTPTTLPPPYPSFLPRSSPASSAYHKHPLHAAFVAPRDDEGMERLPPYTNSISLRAIMPRKLEFSAPGVQARDRRWRRVVCVLEGTSFRVYRCGRGSGLGSAGLGSGKGSGILGGLGEWWERRVGGGDAGGSAGEPSVARGGAGVETGRERKDQRRTQKEAELDAEGEGEGTRFASGLPAVDTSQPRPPATTATAPSTRTRKGFLGSVLQPPGDSRSHLRSRSEMPAPARAGGAQGRPSLNIPRAGAGHSASSSNMSLSVMSSASEGSQSRALSRSAASSCASAPASAASACSSMSDTVEREPPASDIIRAYTLQNAESGLGNDYLKRRHVIRVRLEGEQFLLQAKDVAAVVDWVEGLQAATNIALDLDERPMPKGPTFPRRRRCRPRPATATPTASGTRASA